MCSFGALVTMSPDRNNLRTGLLCFSSPGFLVYRAGGTVVAFTAAAGVYAEIHGTVGQVAVKEEVTGDNFKGPSLGGVYSSQS